MNNNETIAAALREAEINGTNIPAIRESISSAEDAYAIQLINVKKRTAAGERIVGRKVGLTNPAVQQQLGVDQPDYGTLFANMDIPHAGEIAWVPGAQMRVEAEIAFLL